MSSTRSPAQQASIKKAREALLAKRLKAAEPTMYRVEHAPMKADKLVKDVLGRSTRVTKANRHRLLVEILTPPPAVTAARAVERRSPKPAEPEALDVGPAQKPARKAKKPPGKVAEAPKAERTPPSLSDQDVEDLLHEYLVGHDIPAPIAAAISRAGASDQLVEELIEAGPVLSELPAPKRAVVTSKEKKEQGEGQTSEGQSTPNPLTAPAVPQTIGLELLGQFIQQAYRSVITAKGMLKKGVTKELADAINAASNKVAAVFAARGLSTIMSTKAPGEKSRYSPKQTREILLAVKKLIDNTGDVAEIRMNIETALAHVK